MTLRTAFARLLATATMALAAITAQANPVTLRLHGQITGYEFIDLGTAAGLTLGTAMDLTLHFNETWSDRSYDFSDPLGPVSGSATVGSHAFSFTGASPYSYAADWTTGEILSVQPMFTGSGPTLGGGDFFGLLIAITPAMTLDRLLLGYGFTTTHPGGFTTRYGYAQISLDDYSITPRNVNPLPVPATLPLALLALLTLTAAASARQRRR